MKAVIKQGIINVPIKLTPTIKESYYDTGFNQFCGKCGGKVRYKKVCENEGKELSGEEIVKGYAIDKEKSVIFSKQELEALESEDNYTMELFGFKKFADKELADNLIFARKSYYADTQDKKFSNIFQMFKSAIEQEGVVGIVKLTSRNKERVGYLLVRNRVLLFVELPFAESMNSFALNDYKTSEKDIEYARNYVKDKKAEIELSEITNNQKERFKEIISKKLRGETIELEVSLGKLEADKNPFAIALQQKV